MLKLLSAPDPAPAVAVMRQTGVLGHILPGAHDRALAPLIHLDAAMRPDPILRLAALGGAELQAYLSLSKADARRLQALRDAATGPTPVAELAYRLGLDIAHSAAILRAALLEQPVSPELESELQRGSGAIFPVTAADLMPDLSGAALGAGLNELEHAWIESGFELSRAQLLHLLK
jgi:poly(A) polymerase